MPNTVPNQRVIHIHRERATSNFLGIKNENWQAASRTLGAHALRLYLYLASNADNYEVALSPAAIEAAIGMPRSTYHDQFRKLVNYGYIVEKDGNKYDFYETPQTAPRTFSVQPTDGYNFEDNTTPVTANTTAAVAKPSENIEINIDNINSNINTRQEKQVSPVVKENLYVF